MLTIHPLEETLALVLEVISDLLELDRAVIYLPAGEEFQPAASLDPVPTPLPESIRSILPRILAERSSEERRGGEEGKARMTE